MYIKHTIMQHPLWTGAGWPDPGWVKEKNGTTWGKAFRCQPWLNPQNPGLIELLGFQHFRVRYTIHLDAPEEAQVLNTACCEEISIEDTLSSLQLMPDLPSVEDLICMSQKCRSERCLAHAKTAYAHMCDHGLEAQKALGNYLVPMFVDCGSVLDAQQLFNKLAYWNDCSWTCLIKGYVEAGNMHHALNLQQTMQEHRVYPSRYTFVALLTACAELKFVEKGQQLHAEIAEDGLEMDTFVGNTLVNMYANCGSLEESWEVLNRLPIRDVVSWTALIAGYAEHGHGEEALNCLEQMQLEGLTPNAFSFVCALKACGGIVAIAKGREVHAEITMKGFEGDLFVGNTLIDMYAKCCSLPDAHKVFNEMPVQDVVSWTALIAGYAQHGPGEEALKAMEHMQREGVCSNVLTLVCGLKACCSIRTIDKGQGIHAEITRRGFEKELFVGNILVDMYAKQGLLTEAWKVFNQLPVWDVITCTALITGCFECGRSEDALKCLEQMQVWRVSPNSITLVYGLKACGDLGAVDRGHELHCEIANKGLEGDPIVSTTLMDLYARCGLLAEMHALFDSMHVRDVVSWNIVIIGYVEHGESKKALELYAQMKEQGLLPDHGVHVSILKGCGNTAALDIGKKVHALSYRGEVFELNVASALIDMYGKCGNMLNAQQIFDAMPARDLVTWNALITGFAREGDYELAFHLFDRMMWEGIHPDRVAFLTIMSVCSHAGLLDRARNYFELMSKQYGITPTVKHCTCMVDLLGRAGQLEEAVDMVEKMPFEGDPVLWCTVLGACRKWNNVVLGRLAFDRAVGLDEKDSGAYILMSNIYVNAHMWEDAKKIEAMRMHMQALKESERCWTEVSGVVHQFVVGGDTRHSQSQEIMAKLKYISVKLEESGVQNLSCMSRGTVDIAKAVPLCGHSEMLAIACGLINSHEGTPIHVVKNLQVCADCHMMMAFISKVEVRTLVCRDASHLHVFKGGKCLCGGIW